MKINFEFFSQLKLSAYVPEKEVAKVDGYEFMGKEWTGETYGFTDFLQLEKEPGVTRAISLHLQDAIVESFAPTILSGIGVPLKKGMTLEEINALLGKPSNTETFLEDRKTYEYKLEKGKVLISCTVHHDDGLIFISILLKAGYTG